MVMLVKHNSDKVEEKPPAYSEVWRDNRNGNGDTNHSTIRADNIAPTPTVGQLHVSQRNEDIQGTFYIDPSIPRLQKASKKEKRLLGDSNVSFCTRKGDIAINLGTTGSGEKALVVVGTRTGDISVNILPLAADRPRIGLDISSRRGKIVLLIPTSFCGVLQMNTRSGSTTIMPGLARIMQTLKMTAKMKVVQVGRGEGNTRGGDYCEISTRSGEIIVGIVGQDKYTARAGLWQTVGEVVKMLRM
ncbi:hypothetical protein AMATHDRAFT_58339 [Amanita thiersii Skay4041]|uniref:DUF7330 domain-containing protein n=1 Tax=Amanita thiersii Skay4041 TaxID=703135 RepID=A0A2A9NR71_9AGAR|nr:hypothetical protein AMATHDRAFT_58339 [Amanita thiersii Skay4041]